MNRLVLAVMSMIALILTPAAKSADNYLHVKTSQGWEVLDLNKVDRLYFQNNMMNATDANQNVVGSFTQSDLEAMYVDQSSGIHSLPSATTEKVTFTYDATTSIVTLKEAGSIEIFSLNGEQLVKIPRVEAGETVSLKGLANGAIIIKSGKYSAKAIKR